MENSRKYALYSLLIALVIICASLLVINRNYIDNLERQINQRDSLIRELSVSDEIVKEYFNIETDSTGLNRRFSLKNDKKTRIIERIETVHEQQFIIDGKDISAKEVLERYVEFQNQANTIADDNKRLREKYNNLVDKFNSNNRTIDSLRREINIAGLKLNTIQNAYGLSSKCTISGNTYKLSISGNKQIDSALLILPYFRDYLKYEQRDNSWNITLPEKKGSVKIQYK